MNNSLSINSIDAFVFDFDGVLTNNLVYINQNGEESVSCSRSDGLAFDVLRKLKIPAYILSTEHNLVVTERAKKLKIKAIQGVNDKVKAIKKFSKDNSYNLKRIVYVGNDLNDFKAMKLCGFSVCPSDSHIKIQKIADIVLKTQGGEGIVRELLEDVLEIDIIKILYN
jgi:YrbI family 3-deoxy-D-manno-octulosonate 8-phosphate phosphatase